MDKQKMCNLLIIFLLVCSVFPITINSVTADNGNWIIDENSVYVDDSKVFAKATPHTIHGRTWVTFDFRSKEYTGDVDFIWGFDVPTVRPVKCEIWQNTEHVKIGHQIVEHWGTTVVEDVTSYNNLGIENYDSYNVELGNDNNTYLFEVFFDENGNGTSLSKIYAFSEYSVNGNDYILSGNYDKLESYEYSEYYHDWVPFDADWEIISYNHGGMNTWYLLSDVSIVEDVDYKIRALINSPVGFNDNSGKYWWAFKPSSETLSQSISNGHFYCLDPWWDSGWDYYSTIHVPASQVRSTLTNFPILVNITDTTLIGKCKANGEDIRFLADDNSTEYYYEIEEWTSSGANVWVNITSLSSSGTDINMYYGNSGASDNQDSANVWDSDFEVVYHFNDSTGGCHDSTSNKNTGSVAGDLPVYHASKSAWYFDGSGDWVIIPTFTLSGTSTIEGYVQNIDDNAVHEIWDFADGAGRTNQQEMEIRMSDDKIYSRLKWGASENTYYNVQNPGTNDRYHVQSFGGGTCRHSMDTVAYQSGSVSSSGYNPALKYVGCNYAEGNPHEGWYYEFRISNIKRSIAWEETTYNTLSNTSTFAVFGEEHLNAGANNNPTYNTEVPTENSVNQKINPQLSINIEDANGDNMNVSWWSNTSGSWKIFAQTLNQGNGTITAHNENFSNWNKKVWWNVTIEDGMGGEAISPSYNFTTIENYPPTINSESPTNESTGAGLTPTLSIDLSDQEGNTSSIGWESNSSGTWKDFASTTGAGNGTHSTTGTNFTDTNTKYWWRVTVTNDDYNTYNTTTYYFTTASNYAPEISNSVPANGSNQQARPPLTSIDITDGEGDNFNVSWQSNSSGTWKTWGTNLSQTDGTISSTNSNFSASNTTYYWKVIAHDGTSSNTSDIYHFKTLEGVDKPTSATAELENSTNNIFINWSNHENATHTRIQRATDTFPTTISSGTNVYNDTAETYTDTSLTGGKTYYYSLWNYNSTKNEWSSVYATATTSTKPNETINLQPTTIDNDTINVTWTKGEGADTTLVRYKTGSHPTSTTDGTELSNDSTTGQTLDGLTGNTTYYFRAWSYNSTANLYSETNVSASNTTGFQPSNVTNFIITSYNDTQMNLTWTKGDGTGTKTVIRRHESSYPPTPLNGIEVYNGTGSSTTDTGLDDAEDYFYSAWSYNGGVFSSGYMSYNNSTRPVEIDGAGGIQDATTNLNISWNALPSGVDAVVIRKKNEGYPQNLSDGSEIYNGSALYYNYTSYNDGDYFTIWTYNSTVNKYGQDDSGHHLVWGGLTVYVYSENNSQLNGWNITVINEDASPSILEYTGQNNGQSYDIATLPNGADTLIRISCSGYDSRSYYLDINENEQYTLNVYLPDEDLSNLYYFIVLNEYDDPVEDCQVVIKRSIGGSLVNISVLYTDAAGSGNLHLQANALYFVSLLKTGYSTPEPAEWEADPDYYGAYRDYWKTFRIEHSTSEPGFETFFDYCYFEATMNSTGHINISFYDKDTNTTDTHIVVYENSNYSRTAVAWYNDTNNSNFYQIYAGDLNKEYRVVLHLNHSRLGYRVQWRIVNPQRTPAWDEDTIDSKFSNVFGDFELGWTKFLVIFIPCLMFLVAFGANHVGISLIGVGAWLTFSSWFINVNSAVTYVAMAGLIVLLGITTIITKKGRKAT